jgi:ABC-type multidrug transport system fused ATPase/permease subunit
MDYFKNSKFIKNLATTLEFFKKIRFNPASFIIPITISFFAAFLDGLNKAIFIPLIKGMVNLDFSFVYKTPILKDILSFFPNSVTNSDTGIFVFLVVLVFITGLAQYSTLYLASVIIMFQIRKFTNNLRKLIFENFLTFGKLFFDRTSFGKLNAVLMSEVDFISSDIARLQKASTEIFRLFVYLVLLFIISWKLTLLVLLIFPILSYVVAKIIAKIKKTSSYLVQSISKQNRKAFNVLSSISLIKFYSQEKQENEKFSKLSDTRAHLEFSVDKKRNIIRPLQAIFILGFFLLLAVTSFYLVKIEKGSDVSKFLVYIYVLRSISNCFASINLLRATLGAVKVHLKPIFKVFDKSDKYIVPEGVSIFPGLKKEIKFNSLKFSYIAGKQVLNNISFSVNKGETVALVASTGAGKTTIVNLLMRFYDCPPGAILVDGRDIRNYTLNSLRGHMAFVSQDTLLFDGTLRENVIYGLDRVYDKQFYDALKKAGLYDFVQGLPQEANTYIGDRGIQLSGGERQRLSIARALLKNSEILILDEATSSLDTVTEKQIQAAIEEAIKGRTTIVIAHRLSTIKNCDKIIVIDHGVVSESGTLDELLSKKGKFYEFWQEQKFY